MRVGIVVAAAAAVAVGAVAGVAIGSTGASATVTVLAPTPVAYVACWSDSPASTAGTFHRGDRVYLTGRSADSSWAEVRDPSNLSVRVWVPAPAVVVDGDLRQLPTHDCMPPGSGPEGDAAPTTTTIASGETTTTTDTSSTTAPPSTTSNPSPTTSPAPPPPVTVPGGPTVGPLSATRTDLWESYPAFGGHCSADVTSVITGSVTAPAGLSSASMSWSLPGAGGGGTASVNSSTVQATLGPFPYPQAGVTGSPVQVTVTLTVVDHLGRQASRSIVLVLHPASECGQ